MSYIKDDYQNYIAMSRYARWIEEKNRRETWEETVERYVNHFDKHFPYYPKEEIRDAITTLKVMPSMRAMMTAGKALEKCSVPGYNCSYVVVDHPRAFDETLYILMCGTGVGFSVERQYIAKLPQVPEKLYDTETVIVVDDSRIGWAKALKELISLLYAGQVAKWDVSRLRPAGARLKTFGGRSSGPEPLVDLFKFVVKTFRKSEGRKLNSLECHDIMCMIASIVVAGGVRRSALISLSNLSDDRMRNAKNGAWWEYEPQRALANNSVAYTEKPEMSVFMREWLTLQESGSGERGIFNRNAAEKKAKENGRRDTTNHEYGTNPCGEILLRPNQFCNLSEVVVRETDTLETLKEKVKLATIVGTYQSMLTDFKYIRSIWKKNSEEERLLGVSLTGIDDHPVLGKNKDNTLGFSTREMGLEEMKHVAIETNSEWSEKLGINQSVAITTVKPSGCQKPDTLVSTRDGIYKLSELGDRDGDTWQNIEHVVPNENNVCENATRFYNNGVAKTIKLKMKSGLTLECTPDHKYRILSEEGNLEWRAARKISIGDVIPYSVNENNSELPYRTLNPTAPPHTNCQNTITDSSVPLNEDIAWLLGLYFGDGSNHRRGIRIAGSNAHLDHLQRASDILEEKLGLRSNILYHGKQNADLYVNSTHFLAWLTHNGISKQKTSNVEIPLLIRKSKSSVIDSFVSGYCSADGINNHLGRAIVTTSKAMAEQLVTVLRFIGKDASMREMPPTKTTWGTKMRYWVQEKKGLNGNTNRLSRNVQEDIVRLKHILPGSSFLPDYVVEISDGQSLTLDIEVPQGNTYIANSYISHNTVSQLVDSSSGIHPRFSRYYIRRVRGDKKDPLSNLIKDSGVPTEDDVMNPNAYVLSFPKKSPEASVFVEELTAIQQLEQYLTVRKHWCEHNPSITVYVKNDEWLEVGAWVYKHFDEIGGVSFLPKTDHVYKQAPYEEITEQEYTTMVEQMPKIDWSRLSEYELVDSVENTKELACVAGICEI